uniref:Uncharacterized protein n=1 Tax=Osmundaria fimbriata TaxID=228265 RepID=A0A1Z1M4E3_OSMFI|nr:hypothetical protein [Osmundaria fimbriata]ARW60780.1 hypothetical protein [Osmundaria fimbriata]
MIVKKVELLNLFIFILYQRKNIEKRKKLVNLLIYHTI